MGFFRKKRTIKVLLVDDDELVLGAHGSILREAEHLEVYTTSQSNEVLPMACKHNPDIIILDVMMPDKDGAQIAAELRSHPMVGSTPIVFLTGILSQEEADKKKSENYLAKPVAPAFLLETIETLARC